MHSKYIVMSLDDVFVLLFFFQAISFCVCVCVCFLKSIVTICVVSFECAECESCVSVFLICIFASIVFPRFLPLCGTVGILCFLSVPMWHLQTENWHLSEREKKKQQHTIYKKTQSNINYVRIVSIPHNSLMRIRNSRLSANAKRLTKLVQVQQLLQYNNNRYHRLTRKNQKFKLFQILPLCFVWCVCL